MHFVAKLHPDENSNQFLRIFASKFFDESSSAHTVFHNLKFSLQINFFIFFTKEILINPTFLLIPLHQ
jgi:hypothetical protein